MPQMEIDRRAFLAGLGAVLATGTRPGMSAWAQTAPGGREALYAAARREANGAFSAALFSEKGQDIRTVVLPQRGHDATFCPVTQRAVMFARRPGNFAVVFSADRAEAPLTFTTPQDRHFYGHGVFARDGRLLYATENDFEAGHGVIGIYDARANFRRVGEIPSHGVGPHDMALLRRSPVLVIANGGLLEHPDIGGGRRILNPGRVITSLSYIDLESGDLVERHELPRDTAVSLRHLDIAADNTVVLGGQAIHKGDRDCALIFRHRRQGLLEAVEIPDRVRASLAGYVSSIAIDRGGTTAAVTSSKGGVAVMIDVATGTVIRTMERRDVSGVAPASSPAGFLMTSGEGDVLTVRADGRPSALSHGGRAWDNHVAAC